MYKIFDNMKHCISWDETSHGNTVLQNHMLQCFQYRIEHFRYSPLFNIMEKRKMRTMKEIIVFLLNYADCMTQQDARVADIQCEFRKCIQNNTMPAGRDRDGVFVETWKEFISRYDEYTSQDKQKILEQYLLIRKGYYDAPCALWDYRKDAEIMKILANADIPKSKTVEIKKYLQDGGDPAKITEKFKRQKSGGGRSANIEISF